MNNPASQTVRCDVGIGAEELYDDAYHRLAHLRVAGRCLAAAVCQVESVGGYRVEERFLLEATSANLRPLTFTQKEWGKKRIISLKSCIFAAQNQKR